MTALSIIPYKSYAGSPRPSQGKGEPYAHPWDDKLPAYLDNIGVPYETVKGTGDAMEYDKGDRLSSSLVINQDYLMPLAQSLTAQVAAGVLAKALNSGEGPRQVVLGGDHMAAEGHIRGATLGYALSCFYEQAQQDSVLDNDIIYYNRTMTVRAAFEEIQSGFATGDLEQTLMLVETLYKAFPQITETIPEKLEAMQLVWFDGHSDMQGYNTGRENVGQAMSLAMALGTSGHRQFDRVGSVSGVDLATFRGEVLMVGVRETNAHTAQEAMPITDIYPHMQVLTEQEIMEGASIDEFLETHRSPGSPLIVECDIDFVNQPWLTTKYVDRDKRDDKKNYIKPNDLIRPLHALTQSGDVISTSIVEANMAFDPLASYNELQARMESGEKIIGINEAYEEAHKKLKAIEAVDPERTQHFIAKLMQNIASDEPQPQLLPERGGRELG